MRSDAKSFLLDRRQAYGGDFLAILRNVGRLGNLNLNLHLANLAGLHWSRIALGAVFGLSATLVGLPGRGGWI